MLTITNSRHINVEYKNRIENSGWRWRDTREEKERKEERTRALLAIVFSSGTRWFNVRSLAAATARLYHQMCATNSPQTVCYYMPAVVFRPLALFFYFFPTFYGFLFSTFLSSFVEIKIFSILLVLIIFVIK